MYSYGPPHMAEQKQDDQLEPTYSSYVRIRDVAPRTCQKQWTIGRNGERVRNIRVGDTTLWWWRCWWYMLSEEKIQGVKYPTWMLNAIAIDCIIILGLKMHQNSRAKPMYFYRKINRKINQDSLYKSFYT